MNTPILHYIHDPLCGWCYAAAPLVAEAVGAEVPVVLHGGGLWDPAAHASDAKRRMMRETDAHIGRLTGQVFGPAYLAGLLVDPDTVWWSRPTIAAVLAADAVRGGAGVAMIGAVQRAHYVEGRRVVDDEVLAEAAGTVGLPPASFRRALGEVPVDRHIADTHALMHRHGLRGFPSFLLEQDGAFERLPHEDCYGRSDSFVALIHRAASAQEEQVAV